MSSRHRPTTRVVGTDHPTPSSRAPGPEVGPALRPQTPDDLHLGVFFETGGISGEEADEQLRAYGEEVIPYFRELAD